MRKKKLLFLLIVLAIICILGGCGNKVEKPVTLAPCPSCHGTGRFKNPFNPKDYIDCFKCKGKGYVEYTKD